MNLRRSLLVPATILALALVPSLAAEAKTFNGTNKPDNVKGTPKNDKFKGKGGNDKFTGWRVTTRPGAATATTGSRAAPAADMLYGENDNDKLNGGGGNDLVPTVGSATTRSTATPATTT